MVSVKLIRERGSQNVVSSADGPDPPVRKYKAFALVRAVANGALCQGRRSLRRIHGESFGPWVWIGGLASAGPQVRRGATGC